MPAMSRAIGSAAANVSPLWPAASLRDARRQAGGSTDITVKGFAREQFQPAACASPAATRWPALRNLLNALADKYTWNWDIHVELSAYYARSRTAGVG